MNNDLYRLFKQQKLQGNPNFTDVELDALIESEFIWWFKKAVRFFNFAIVVGNNCTNSSQLISSKWSRPYEFKHKYL